MKRAKLLSIICILVILISLTACVAENEPQDNDALLGTITEISKYGNVKISTTKAEMAAIETIRALLFNIVTSILYLR